MTAASSPPPRDGEVRNDWCGPGSHHMPPCPAAPSEPPAADSPTPGTETWGEWTGGGYGPIYAPLRTAAPSPVDTTEPPTEAGVAVCFCRDGVTPHEPGSEGCRDTEPPAETQQDDDAALPWHVDPQDSHRIADRNGAGVATAFSAADAARIVAALAARPSADTERLRDDEMPFVLKLNGQDVTVAEVPDLPERGLTFLTYNYRTAIQIRSVDDLDGRVLLHEVLHALLRTDPQQVCPAADSRHEDFVRMLTAGLHDAAGYRRLRAALDAR